jgi:hypothetical protein
MHRCSIDNLSHDIDISPRNAFIHPRPFLDLLDDTVAVPHSVLLKRVLRREKGMECLKKQGYPYTYLISFRLSTHQSLINIVPVEKPDQQPQLKRYHQRTYLAA